MMSNQLHCGACHENMASVEELELHLKSCPAAKALLGPITAVAFGAPDPSHKAAHLLYTANKNVGVIKEYAMAISMEMNSLERAKIHSRMCDRLGLDYSKFKPFESEEITEVPSTYEAVEIIWDAINKEVWSHIGERK